MCRRNGFWGLVVASFGAGLLLGLLLEGTFWSYCLGIGLIILGGSMFCRK